ncbi:MAG: SWIM zinc finger protein [Barrevirus sp.]|uniref:SWIM zinc finger protein n=1 Tax=Barrevirus sp. TaxID=2487763 RepID=A0A3G4ZPJ2_9VIRU|nr:MAG: SWIM zinc finger protein [Barrevirus sp.]
MDCRKVKAQIENITIASSSYNKDGTRSYTVTGSTGKQYNVEINEHPCCSCPDFVSRGSRCKHIYFVLKKSLNVSDKELDTFVLKKVVKRTELIYENLLSNTFTFVNSTELTDPIAGISAFIEKTYGESAAINLVKLFKDEMKQEDILKDKKFAGPYLVKVNDGLYDLHLRTINKVNNGWLFDNIIEKRKSERVGRFIFVKEE